MGPGMGIGLADEIGAVLRNATGRELAEIATAVDQERTGRAVLRERDDSIHDTVHASLRNAEAKASGREYTGASVGGAQTSAFGTAPAVDLHGIGWALKQMHNGARVARRGWNGPGQYLQLQYPDSLSKMSLPYVFITTAQGQRVPWLASQTDLLARDWFVR